ncbi:hypothetical protein LZ554_002388 [Drepanopeziza brunnea f. sp. 'monogermtubi']|nr:hypothetical protein LZ554_002388 [Drepanopeziza brunnea f. sp. 'monogermtubi']
MVAGASRNRLLDGYKSREKQETCLSARKSQHSLPAGECIHPFANGRLVSSSSSAPINPYSVYSDYSEPTVAKVQEVPAGLIKSLATTLSKVAQRKRDSGTARIDFKPLFSSQSYSPGDKQDKLGSTRGVQSRSRRL